MHSSVSQYSTRFNAWARSGDEETTFNMNFSESKDVAEATEIAIDTACFYALCYHRPWDPENMTVILTLPKCPTFPSQFPLPPST